MPIPQLPAGIGGSPEYHLPDADNNIGRVRTHKIEYTDIGMSVRRAGHTVRDAA